MKSNKIILSFLALLLPFSQVLGQEVEMADFFRSNGKIYVVIAVMTIVFAGIAIYLLYLDTRIRKLEKDRKK